MGRPRARPQSPTHRHEAGTPLRKQAGDWNNHTAVIRHLDTRKVWPQGCRGAGTVQLRNGDAVYIASTPTCTRNHARHHARLRPNLKHPTKGTTQDMICTRGFTTRWPPAARCRNTNAVAARQHMQQGHHKRPPGAPLCCAHALAGWPPECQDEPRSPSRAGCRG